MTVRLANTSDMEGVEAVLAELHTDGFDHQNFVDSYQAILDSSDRALFVVDDSQSIAGMAVVNLIEKLTTREARIDEVVVSSQSRGKGYGAMLMQACDEWAFSRGADVIEFTSRSSRQAANALYQKLGYVLRETNVYQRKRG